MFKTPDQSLSANEVKERVEIVQESLASFEWAMQDPINRRSEAINALQNLALAEYDQEKWITLLGQLNTALNDERLTLQEGDFDGVQDSVRDSIVKSSTASDLHFDALRTSSGNDYYNGNNHNGVM